MDVGRSRGRRARRCWPSGKVRYRNRLDATRALANTRRMAGAQGGPVRVYCCRWCGDGWHLTSQEAHVAGYQPSAAPAGALTVEG